MPKNLLVIFYSTRSNGIRQQAQLTGILAFSLNQGQNEHIKYIQLRVRKQIKKEKNVSDTDMKRQSKTASNTLALILSP